jgi:phosphotransferase system enzyme I (PtsP)
VTRSLTPTIHARGDARLDAVLDLVAFAARPCPLSTSLDEIPRRIARIFRADVCSIYLLEGGDLVMRGNVGFRSDALGEVRLAVGEGVTGLAVETMRPISLEAAPEHESFRAFPELGEERYPVFLAMPVAGHDGPLGALVLQRRDAPGFDRADIELAAALTAPIAAAAERAHLADALGQGARRTAGGGTRRVTLPGRPVVPGRAVGAVCAFRRPAARQKPEGPRPVEEMVRALAQAVAQAQRTVGELEKRARGLGLEVQFLDGVRTILDDARLRERAIELAEGGQGLAQALGSVGVEASRVAARHGDAFGVERAREIVDVCEALAMLAAGDRRAELPRSAVLVGDQVTLFDLLVSARSQPAAVMLSTRTGPASRTLLQLLGVPAVSDVAGLFRWVSDGDIVLVDGDHGIVRLNPSRAEVAAVRAEKKRGEG